MPVNERNCGVLTQLIRLTRQKLRLATGILAGHSQLNRHLSVMGIISDPTCNYCEEGLETAVSILSLGAAPEYRPTRYIPRWLDFALYCNATKKTACAVSCLVKHVFVGLACTKHKSS